MRPSALPPASVNQRFLSRPTTMCIGAVPTPEVGYSVISPDVVIRPILPALYSANQSAPSGPRTIMNGWAFFVGTSNSVISPAIVIRPIRPAPSSVNQSAPSEPAATLQGPLAGCGSLNSVNFWVRRSNRAMRSLTPSVIQILPSGPGPSPAAPLPCGITNSVIFPVGVILAITPRLPSKSLYQTLPSGPFAMTSTWLVGCSGKARSCRRRISKRAISCRSIFENQRLPSPPFRRNVGPDLFGSSSILNWKSPGSPCDADKTSSTSKDEGVCAADIPVESATTPAATNATRYFINSSFSAQIVSTLVFLPFIRSPVAAARVLFVGARLATLVGL